ncbi:DgyrCDS12999 [Dimorphilus gyrociliatus]|uniref:Chloride channel protein n=1 Tax=Dimorphilus gyrociliatus TaxID=2664684 RepID=A0A7I8W9B8_9ANNE|nr:DgyrCDS12999 [Dimorphilus gyrociliatus]
MKQRQEFDNYSSVNYMPAHSDLYLSWLKEHPLRRLDWDRWLLMSMIGIIIGLVAFLLKQTLAVLDDFKWNRARELASESIIKCWGWTAGISIAFVLISSIIIVFIHPPAGGSGVPETITFLNGIVVHKTQTLRNFIAKFASVVFAVSSGLPCAIQGPIISLGAIIGSGVGQFQSKSLGFRPNWFSRFRNAEDRRTFTTAGVAAGVAAAFNAPIGGLLFAMEDLSSHWNRKLSWQTFFCCCISVSVANSFNSAFDRFKWQGSFGLFNLWVAEPIQVNILMLLPAIILGLIGGVLGAIFTRLNVAIIELRKFLFGKIKNLNLQRLARIIEPCIIVFIMSVIVVLMPNAFQCTEDKSREGNITAPILKQCNMSFNTFQPDEFSCKDNSTYNEAATLLVGSGNRLLSRLVSRGTHRWFHYRTLLAILPVWFFMVSWTAGTSVAGGIFVPTLISGAIYGRAFGLAILDIYTSRTGHQYPIDSYWEWIDPGAIAMLGAGSLLGGVTRLCLAVTMIIVEMSQDIDFVIPVMISIWSAKVVADQLALPLYKFMLNIKSLPYLDAEAEVVIDNEIVNLELYKASHIMASSPKTIHSVESLSTLARLLLGTKHGGFPVVKYDEVTKTDICYGLITRNELYIVMCCDDVYNEEQIGKTVTPTIEWEKISVDYLTDPSAMEERVRTYTKFDQYRNIYVNLEQFIDKSCTKVDQEYSVHRVYTLFRTLGLRHLLVIDSLNRIVGIITRKDLMNFNIHEKLCLFENSLKIDDNLFISSAGCSMEEKGEKDSVVYQILPAVTIPRIDEEIEEGSRKNTITSFDRGSESVAAETEVNDEETLNEILESGENSKRCEENLRKNSLELRNVKRISKSDSVVKFDLSYTDEKTRL